MEWAQCIFYSHLVLMFIAWVFIFKSVVHDRVQKRLQVIFSVVLPILGPTIVIIVHYSDTIKTEKPSDRYMGQTIDESPYSWYWPFP